MKLIILSLIKGICPFILSRLFRRRIIAMAADLAGENHLRLALRLVDSSDQLYLFGISDGTLRESFRASERNIPIYVYIAEFDPSWTKYYEALKPRIGNFLDVYLKEANLLG